jgi:hypothetical protein
MMMAKQQVTQSVNIKKKLSHPVLARRLRESQLSTARSAGRQGCVGLWSRRCTSKHMPPQRRAYQAQPTARTQANGQGRYFRFGARRLFRRRPARNPGLRTSKKDVWEISVVYCDRNIMIEKGLRCEMMLDGDAAQLLGRSRRPWMISKQEKHCHGITHVT